MMHPPDLWAEWHWAQARMDAAAHHRLMSLGVKSREGLACPYSGVARAGIAGRLYVPDPSGLEVYILPIFDPAPLHVCDRYGIDDVELVELVAWLPEQPERWFYRLGETECETNALAAEEALASGVATVIHPTPLSWLRLGGFGTCPLWLAEAHHTAARRRRAEARRQSRESAA